MSKAIMKSTKGTAIQQWGDSTELNELKGRLLQVTMPGGTKLSPIEAVTLATVALQHGLNPINGEIWYLKNTKGNAMGVMVGIKGLRRKAHEQLALEANGATANYWPEFEMLTQEEKSILGIPLRALAYRCKIRDTLTTNGYTDEIKTLLEAGVPWDAVEHIVGVKPYTEGIGYGLPEKPDPECSLCNGSGKLPKQQGDRYARNCSCYERSKMTLVARAQKRAEAEALKRRFDLPFSVSVGQSDVIDGSYSVIEDGNGGPTEEHPEWSDETLETDESRQDAFPSVEAALDWAMYHPSAFRHKNHARNASNKLKEEKNPQNAVEMAALWRENVAHRRADLEAAQQ